LQERKFFLSPAMTSFAIAFDDEEETTGIINPQHSTLSSQQYYTLDGITPDEGDH
jgi:hypothetical protein